MNKLHNHFNICIVSPELQGRNNKSELIKFVDNIKSYDINDIYVCTKYPDLWSAND